MADQVTAHVIARLQARGLLDDTAYAHAYLPARLASRGYGPYHHRVACRQKLWAFLCRRGFPAASVQQVLTETIEDAATGGEANPLNSSTSSSDLSPSPLETG